MALKWKDSLSVGVDIIDRQHRELIDRINQLLQAMMDGRGAQEIDGVVCFLEEYIIEHFGLEEAYMRQYDYPGYNEHAAEHAAFVKDFQRLKAQLEGQLVLALPVMQVQRRVCDWIVYHIGCTDTRLGAFLREKL